MCGITGYIGYRPADKILFDCLKRLEYRGYDSCGIALVEKNGIRVEKDVKRIKDVEAGHIPSEATIGIGHTRWATCGEPVAKNAHPHTDCHNKVSVVHNGTIDNYLDIKRDLECKGHYFITETDTEVVPHLIEENLKTMKAEDAVINALRQLKGSFAIAAVIENDNHLYLGRINCPLVIGVMDGEYVIASDSTTLSKYTNRFIYLNDGDIAIVSKDHVDIIRDNTKIKPNIETVDREISDIELMGYPHFMLKEIHEEPKVLQKVIDDIDNIRDLLSNIETDLGEITSIRVIACGSSYYASSILRYLAPEYLGIPVFCEIGSEMCSLTKAPKGSLVIAISQSGETADTIKACKNAKAFGYKVLSITNVTDSQLSRLADYKYITAAGPEISVAATKTVMSQIAMMYAMTIAHPKLSSMVYDEYLSNFKKLPELIKNILDNVEEIQKIAKYLEKFEDIIYVAKGLNYPIALEGALKMKEIAYIHAEGYASGELKHGPFALLSENIPVVALVSHDKSYDSIVTNLREIKTRKAPVITITSGNDIAIENVSDYVINVPECNEELTPILHLVVVQLLAYYVTIEKGYPVDFPRNLAKTVTVE